MRRTATALVAVTLLVGLFGHAPGRTSCAAPEVSFDGRDVVPGDDVTFRGRYWANGCDDTSTCTRGCTGTVCDDFEPAEPTGPVTIRIRPTDGGGPWTTLAEDVPVGSGLRFEVTARIPADLTPGRYEVDARSVDGISGYSDDVVVAKSSPSA